MRRVFCLILLRNPVADCTKNYLEDSICRDLNSDSKLKKCSCVYEGEGIFMIPTCLWEDYEENDIISNDLLNSDGEHSQTRPQEYPEVYHSDHHIKNGYIFCANKLCDLVCINNTIPSPNNYKNYTYYFEENKNSFDDDLKFSDFGNFLNRRPLSNIKCLRESSNNHEKIKKLESQIVNLIEKHQRLKIRNTRLRQFLKNSYKNALQAEKVKINLDHISKTLREDIIKLNRQQDTISLKNQLI